jgi:uncharacterized protein
MKKVRRVFAPGSFRLSVRRARTGRGLFTEEPIPRGACIIEYIGRPATPAEQKANTAKYLFWTSDTTMINGNVASNTARYINHACRPNCEVDLKARRIYIFAARNIKPGEELTYDYGEEYFDMLIKPAGCLCPSCEKKREPAIKRLQLK